MTRKNVHIQLIGKFYFSKYTFFNFTFYCKKYNTKQSIWVILDFNDGE